VPARHLGLVGGRIEHLSLDVGIGLVHYGGVPTISAPRVLIDGELRGPSALVIEGGLIVETVNGRPAAAPDHVALDSGILSPGLIDVQINGCLGVDFSEATEDEWLMISRALPAMGVTAFQPTFITAPIPVLVSGLRAFAAVRPVLDAAGGAHAVGVHLEGPFLSPAKRGVHDAAFMVQPTPANLDGLLRDPEATAQISMITLAPELPGALEAIRLLTAAGIMVSLGHSDATGAQVHDAAMAGATMVTHIFNAQRGFGHREPGVAGQALAEPSLTIGLVADLEHVCAAACEVTLNAAAGRVAIVSDAVAMAGMPPGSSRLGPQRITVRAGEQLPRNGDGTIAGSVTFLDGAVRNLVGIGRDIAEVLNAATTVPADVLGRADIGRLAAGARADIVWWSDTLHPQRTWIDGREVGATRSW
jgi:N-acetylglucosamine-6-phosphate deacetylase